MSLEDFKPFQNCSMIKLWSGEIKKTQLEFYLLTDVTDILFYFGNTRPFGMRIMIHDIGYFWVNLLKSLCYNSNEHRLQCLPFVFRKESKDIKFCALRDIIQILLMWTIKWEYLGEIDYNEMFFDRYVFKFVNFKNPKIKKNITLDVYIGRKIYSTTEDDEN